MKQVYDLMETIEQDKDVVATLERRLHNARGILEAHTEALGRLTTAPMQSPAIVEKVAQGTPEETRERITRDNWEELGIREGDEVDIVFCSDASLCKGTHTITDVEWLCYGGDVFLEAGDRWLWFRPDTEVYLIRTEDGSLYV